MLVAGNTRRGHSRINHIYGALCNRSLWCGRATIPREKCGGRPAAFPRESPEKGTGANYSARGAAPICGKETGIMANSITRSGEESGRASERATWCKNARNCRFSHCNPVTRRSHEQLLETAKERISR